MKRTIILSTCVVLVFLSVGNGLGADDSLTLSVSARQEYNDNIFYDERDQMDDLVTMITPGVSFDRETERVNVTLDGRVVSRWYNENEDLNASDQRYSAGIDAGITDRITAGASLNFDRDSTRDRDIETSGILLTNVERDKWTYQFSGNYFLSEKSRLGFNVAFHEEEFEDDAEDEFDDFKYRQAGFSCSRYLTEDITLQAQASFALYEYPQQEVENYSGTVGIGKQMTETLSGYIHLGGRRTKFLYLTYTYDFDTSTFQFIPVPVENEIDKTGFVGNMGISWQGETASLNISAEHDLQATSGTNRATRRTGMNLSLSRRLTERVSVGLAGSFFENQSDKTEYSSEVERQTVRVTTRLQYRIRDWISLSVAYRYTRIEASVDRESVDNNTAWILLSLQHDMMDH